MTDDNAAESTAGTAASTKKASKPKAKAKAKKPAAKAKKSKTESTRTYFSDDMLIKITDQERADKMREDSRRRQSFNIIKPGMTVEKYKAKGGDSTDLNIMAKLGIVKVA